MTRTRPGGRGRLLLIFGVTMMVLPTVLAIIWIATDGREVEHAGAPSGVADVGVGEVVDPTGPGAAPGDVGEAERAPDSTAPTTTTEPPGPSELTLVFAGDLLPHMPVNDKAAEYGRTSGRDFDYVPMFEPVRPILEGADLAICHMEVPTAPEGQLITSYPSFGAPPELAIDAGAAGYDGCSTASNHSLDRGRAGLDRLLDTFDLAGMGHTGTARTEDEGDGRARLYDVDGVKIAHLSYAYDFNGYRIPEDAPWSVNQIDPNKIIARSEEARADGADLVVLSLHWGDEYVHDPTLQQEAWAEQILASPAVDVIIGHHAHVVQPISRVADRYVVWGLGNQVSNQAQPPRRDGLTVRVRAVRDDDGGWSIGGIDAIPTYVDLATYRILPVVETLRDGTEPDWMNDQLRASYERTAQVLGRRPTDGVTLEPVP